jgi:hypothetical protein
MIWISTKQEDGVVIYLYNCFWALPGHSLWGPSPAELRPYFTVSFETPPTWKHLQSQSHVTTDSQSVCLGVKSTLELVTRYYFLSESCCVVFVGALSHEMEAS